MPTRYVTINGRQVIDPRSTRAWRVLRDQVVAEEPHCWLQLDNICTGASQTADHILTVTQRPDLALDRTNLHGACTPCNEHRGNLPIEALNLGGSRTDQARPAALAIFD